MSLTAPLGLFNKVCTKCGSFRPTTEFRTTKTGFAGSCKPCDRAYHRAYYRKKVGPKRAYRKNVDSYSDEYAWKLALVRRYNVTPERYQELYDAQQGLCAICQSTAEARRADKKRLAVDHDRSCCPGAESCGGCVRGLLCIPCNVSLGGFQDNPEWLRRAATYIAQRGRHV